MSTTVVESMQKNNAIAVSNYGAGGLYSLLTLIGKQNMKES